VVYNFGFLYYNCNIIEIFSKSGKDLENKKNIILFYILIPMASTRKKSHCTKIKKPVKCIRFKGCNYASGTRRKFCRKKRNTYKNKMTMF
jgi:hypothetical protein